MFPCWFNCLSGFMWFPTFYPRPSNHGGWMIWVPIPRPSFLPVSVWVYLPQHGSVNKCVQVLKPCLKDRSMPVMPWALRPLSYTVMSFYHNHSVRILPPTEFRADQLCQKSFCCLTGRCGRDYLPDENHQWIYPEHHRNLYLCHHSSSLWLTSV